MNEFSDGVRMMILPKCPYCGRFFVYKDVGVIFYECHHCALIAFGDDYRWFPIFWRFIWEETGWEEVG